MFSYKPFVSHVNFANFSVAEAPSCRAGLKAKSMTNNLPLAQMIKA
jgi:hypothetical protein